MHPRRSPRTGTPLVAGRDARAPVGSSAFVAVGLCLFFAVATPANAIDVDSIVKIHGFGGWSYAETDGLAYTLGDQDGTYDTAEFALNISAQPYDRLSIVAQVFLDSSADELDGGSEAELDYAFAEWFFSDGLKLRIGRVKHPFGIYGEIFDVGTLRPFQLLPQSIYGPNGFTAKAYDGIGVTGGRGAFGGWGLQYDLYVGEVEGDFEIPGLLSTAPDLLLAPNVSLGFQVEDMIGVRFSLTTPVDGLTLGVSAYQGDETVGGGLVGVESRDTYLLHLEYLTDRWSIRSEWGGLEHGSDFEEEGGYLEVAFKLDDHWQLAARTEEWEVEYPSTDLSMLPAILSKTMDHQELAVGVNYWVSPAFVLRINYHEVEGNRFAFPGSSDGVGQALATGQLEDQTELLVVGAQFSF